MSRTALAIAGLAAALAACNSNAHFASRMTGGDPERGRQVMRQYGCPACHTIPGVPGAAAVVGPPLTAMARRSFVAGHLPNTPENLIRWIRHPQQTHRPTAMPELGVTEDDGRHIAAYLYTLR